MFCNVISIIWLTVLSFLFLPLFLFCSYKLYLVSCTSFLFFFVLFILSQTVSISFTFSFLFWCFRFGRFFGFVVLLCLCVGECVTNFLMFADLYVDLLLSCGLHRARLVPVYFTLISVKTMIRNGFFLIFCFFILFCCLYFCFFFFWFYFCFCLSLNKWFEQMGLYFV